MINSQIISNRQNEDLLLKISIKIEAIQSHAERELTAETVKELQELIDERREIPVLEINIIHKLKAKQYSSSYEESSK